MFATVYDQGVFFFNARTHKFHHLNSVRNYRTRKIFFDVDDNAWINTNKGLAELIHYHSTYRIISYFKKGGLQNNESSDRAFYDSPINHQFFFGGISEFNVFNPLNISHSNYMPVLRLYVFFFG